jgi:hypothetical protein
MTDLATALRDFGISMRATHEGRRALDDDGRDWEHDAWSCTFRKSGEQGSVTFPYRAGIGHEGRTPKAADVMGDLLLDAESYDDADGFEDWARDFGYDTDSRRAERMYLACGETSRRLRNYLGADVYTRLMAAERD